MKITEVSAVVRYSAEIKGSWRAIELASTASLTSSDETLESVSDELYRKLMKQLRVLWANGNGKTETQEQPSNGSGSPATARQHFCVEHSQEYKKRNGPHGEFYSHQIKGSKNWCNEKS
jgi:hypothetical protein